MKRLFAATSMLAVVLFASGSCGAGTSDGKPHCITHEGTETQCPTPQPPPPGGWG